MKTHAHWTLVALAGAALALGGCKKDAEPAAPAPAAKEAPAAGKVNWDSPDKAQSTTEVDWPIAGVAAGAPGGAQSFAKGGAVVHPNAVWQKLGEYKGTVFLKQWRENLSGDPGSATDIVDAFNELAYAVTGPAGFWRKTVPNQWLGCVENAETEPCKKVTEMQKELGQWDKIQDAISKLAPEKAAAFLSRNSSRMLAYMDTYVPTEPSMTAIKTTPFYKKHLAAALDAVLKE